jgi:hypothetical protein
MKREADGCHSLLRVRELPVIAVPSLPWRDFWRFGVDMSCDRAILNLLHKTYKPNSVTGMAGWL